jgi:hypothetical protein
MDSVPVWNLFLISIFIHGALVSSSKEEWRGSSVPRLISLSSFSSQKLKPGGFHHQTNRNNRPNISPSATNGISLLTQPKGPRLRPPLNRPRPKTGIQRRASGIPKDMVHFYLYPDPLYELVRAIFDFVIPSNCQMINYLALLL